MLESIFFIVSANFICYNARGISKSEVVNIMLNVLGSVKKIKRGSGMFLAVSGETGEHLTELGILEYDCFSAAYRINSCWMAIKNGKEGIPEETQYLMLKEGKRYMLLFALSQDSARTALFADGKRLFARTETYDASLPVGEVLAVYITEGEDPYALIESAYAEMQSVLGTFSLKYGKQAPDFADYFGFCTYNALGANVTEQTLIEEAKLFRENAIPVGFFIADDGWQSHDQNMLSSFYADEKKFPHGLKATAVRLKEEYGLKELLCWHTYNGYWQGIKREAFPQFDVKTEYFRFPDRFKSEKAPTESGTATDTVTGGFYPDNILGEPCGFVQGDLYEFYRQFYACIREQGADGAKIDAMTWAEAFSEARGGRVAMIRNMVSGVEKASLELFGGEHINCSSCSNDFFFNTHAVGVTRVSTDYAPECEDGCFHHLYSGAYVGLWTQPVVFADWDMFQSGNRTGKLHAKARAVSGGPVYCSDNRKTLDRDVILPLLSKGGYVAKCKKNAVPTEDCLFLEEGEKKPLKIFNQTACAYVLGILNCSPSPAETGARLADINGLPVGMYAVYSDERGFLGEFDRNASFDISLAPFGGEILTVSPVQEGVAVVGLKGKYNPSGFVREKKTEGGACTVDVLDDGEYLIYFKGRGIVTVQSVEKMLRFNNY